MNPYRQPVAEKTQAAEARRTAAELCRQMGFDETLAGKVAIAITEAGNNLATHAQGGELLVSGVRDLRGAAVEVLAVDHGPGMNVERCLEDGYSSAGTAGTGLGAIRRLASEFDAWSDRNGSVVYARFAQQDASGEPVFRFGCVRAAKFSENVCGDDWAIRQTPGGVAAMLADGLGHGEFAADAARKAVSAFLHPNWNGAVDSLEALHGALRGSRGASVAVAHIDAAGGEISFAGLGNIAGIVFHPAKIQRMVSHNGTAGHNATRVAGFRYVWAPGSTLVMHSDGLASHWTLDAYPGLAARHPSVIAGVLYRDHSRGRDDVTVLVLKQE